LLIDVIEITGLSMAAHARLVVEPPEAGYWATGNIACSST